MFPKERNPHIERVQYELRSRGLKSELQSSLRSGIHNRGYLPHIKCEGAAYVITFRLADSLPQEILVNFQAERAEQLRRCVHELRPNKATPAQVRNRLDEIDREYQRKIERFLDRSYGECWLKRPDVAQLVSAAICHFEHKRYKLDAWVVMPNHVHVVIWPLPNQILSGIVKVWKGYTAREANKLLDRTGHEFWQRESYDHWIRNDIERERCIRYTINNPVTAGLCRRPEDDQRTGRGATRTRMSGLSA